MPVKYFAMSSTNMGCGSRALGYVNCGCPKESRLYHFLNGIREEYVALGAYANKNNQTCILWNDRLDRAGAALADLLRSRPDLGTVFESPEYTNMHYSDDHKLRIWGFIANVGACLAEREKLALESSSTKFNVAQ